MVWSLPRLFGDVWVYRRSSFLDFLFAEDKLGEEKDNPCDNEEVDECTQDGAGEEMKWTEVESFGAPRSARDEEHYKQHKNTINDAADEGVQFSANNDGNCKTYHTVFLDELNEFLQHGRSPW